MQQQLIKNGNDLKKYRRRNKLRQNDISAMMSVSFGAVSKWERGDVFPLNNKILLSYYAEDPDKFLKIKEAIEKGK